MTDGPEFEVWIGPADIELPTEISGEPAGFEWSGPAFGVDEWSVAVEPERLDYRAWNEERPERKLLLRVDWKRPEDAMKVASQMRYVAVLARTRADEHQPWRNVFAYSRVRFDDHESIHVRTRKGLELGVRGHGTVMVRGGE